MTRIVLTGNTTPAVATTPCPSDGEVQSRSDGTTEPNPPHPPETAMADLDAATLADLAEKYGFRSEPAAPSRVSEHVREPARREVVWDGRIWLSDEFSVPAETLCLHEPPEPNRDFRCVRAKGHKGRHEHRYAQGLYRYVPKPAPAGSRTASQAPGKDALASDLNQEALLAALAKQEGRGG